MKNFFLKSKAAFRLRRKTFSVFLLIFMGAVLRLVWLKQIPFRVDGDAARFGLDGLGAWQEHQSVFSTGWYGHHEAIFYLYGIWGKIVKDRILALRLFSALGGILGLGATFLFIRRVFNFSVAFWAALFLAVCPFHLVFSRMGTEVIWMTFFTPLSLFFLWRRQKRDSFLAGIFVGLSQYFYPGARFIPFLVAALLLIFLFHCLITKKEFFLLAFWVSVGFLLVYFPMMRFYYYHPQKYNERINIVGIWQSGWLKREMISHSLPEIIFSQLVRSYSAFCCPIPQANLIWFYRTPFLDSWFIVFFLIGIILGIKGIKREEEQFLFFYLLGGIFLAGALTVNSPTPSRYTILFPVVAAFIGKGIDWWVKKVIPLPFGKMTVISFLVFIVLGSIFSYWQHDTQEIWQYDLNTQVASYVGRFLLPLKENNFQVYFLANQNLYYQALPALPYLAGKKGKDIFFPLSQEIEKIDWNSPLVIIAPLSRRKELAVLRDVFPAGKIISFYNPRQVPLADVFINFDYYSFGK